MRLLCPDGEDRGRYYDYTGRAIPAIDCVTGEVLDGEWSTRFGNGTPTHWAPLHDPPEAKT